MGHKTHVHSLSKEWRLGDANEGSEIPQCLKYCKSNDDCESRDQCELGFSGGTCLPKQCPLEIDFGMLKRRNKTDSDGKIFVEYTIICHTRYILRHPLKNEVFRFHHVGCEFNITGGNHVKWVFKKESSLKPASRDQGNIPGIEAICENG